VRSGTATTRRVRLVVVLSVAAAITVVIGAILMAMHEPAHRTRLGPDLVAVGVVFGVVVFAIGRAGRSRPRARRADHRRGAPRPEPAAASRGRGGGDGAARSGRPPLLNPTNVYTPGGLIDPPGEGRAPGTPDGHDIPEILRTAGPGPAPGGPVPGAHAGGRGQERPPSGWAGPQPPRPGYPPGMNQGGPGRMPYGLGGQPAPPVPPHDYGRPREAPRAGHPMPGRHGAPGREPIPPRGAGSGQSPRDASRPGPLGPGGPIRPGGPVPPRDPAYPPPGPGRTRDRGAGQYAAGPGYGAPGAPGAGAPGYAAPGPGAPGPGASSGRRPGPPGHADGPGYRRPADETAPFDGGYAKVIRASDHPGRPPGRARPPGFGRPAEPIPPAGAPAGVYVYRDTGDQPGGPAASGQGPGGNDAAYWYDLPGSAAGPAAPPQSGEEARGPFEPLVSSSDPPGAARRSSAGPGTAEPAVPDTAHADQAPGDSGAGDAPAESAYDRARKLEQIKDLYLTAEAIGEANVDKHFDQLLAQQRELISDYFRQPGPAGSAAGAAPPGAQPAGAQPPGAQPPGAQPPGAQPAGQAGSAGQPETDPRARLDPGPDALGPLPGGPATPPEGVGVAADQPRAW